MAYQSFGDEKGDSRSAEKLRAIRLPADLSGKSVLDIGCNEGYFCQAALDRGAARVVGIDTNAAILENARRRVPGAEFRHQSWWDLGNGRFDYILFLSAIHYEKQQKRLLDKLVTNLAPNGTLILEAGMVMDWDKKSWKLVQRADGVVRFPTLGLLADELLSRYSVRTMGASVAQAGDPQERHVLHCTPRRPTLFLISGASKAGKSSFARLFAARGIRTIHLDVFIGQLSHLPASDPKHYSHYLKSVGVSDIALFSRTMQKDGRSDDLARLLMQAITKDDDITIVEGYPLTIPEFDQAVRKLAQADGYKIVSMTL
jgi:SAM-dependent methyltransferase